MEHNFFWVETKCFFSENRIFLYLAANFLWAEATFLLSETPCTIEPAPSTESLSFLTLSRWRPLSYRNQSIDLLCESMNWFLYDNGLRHERANRKKNFPAVLGQCSLESKLLFELYHQMEVKVSLNWSLSPNTQSKFALGQNPNFVRVKFKVKFLN